MDPFTLACGVAGFVGLPPLITVCTQGYGMLSAAHVYKDWKDLDWRRKILETRFNDWKNRVQIQDGGLAASLKADHNYKKPYSWWKYWLKLSSSKYHDRSKDVPTAIGSSLFRALSVVAAPVIFITPPTAYIFLRYLELSESLPGTYFRFKVVEAASTMGSAYKNLGYYNQAEELYQMALAGYEKALGKDHLPILDTVDNMASVFISQERYDEALELYQRSLMEREKVLGKESEGPPLNS
ncbi:hypothetical protein RUND412_000920 [Rhizina undulata]